jgi:hypothetical protein
MYGAQRDLLLRQCSLCKQNLDVTHFSFNQLNKSATGLRCKACISKSAALSVTPESSVSLPSSVGLVSQGGSLSPGVLVSVLFENVQHLLRQRLQIQRELFDQRLSRLHSEGVIRLSAAKWVTYVAADYNTIALKKTLSQQAAVTPVTKQSSRPFHRAISINADPTLLSPVASISFHALLRQESSADASSDLSLIKLDADITFLPEVSDKPLFIKAELLLEDTKFVISDICDRLGHEGSHVSRSLVIVMLSDKSVRWDHRLVCI